VDRLPEGPPPRLGYAIGRTYTAPDGQQVRLRLRGRPGLASVAPLGNDYLVTTDSHFEGTTSVVRIGPDGRPNAESRTITGAPVLTAGTLRWITFTPPESLRQRSAHLHRADVATGTVTSSRFEPPRNRLPSLRGVIGDDLILTDGFDSPTWVTGPSGTSTLPGSAITVSPTSRLIATAVWSGRGRATARVIAHPSGEVLWRDEGVDPVAFSPSGDRLVTRTSDGIAVLDARSGDVRAVLDHTAQRRQRHAVDAIVWEDDRTLLLTIRRNDRAAVVRVGPATGTWERTVDWTPLNHGQVSFGPRQ
jgi:WD40 repeat protein